MADNDTNQPSGHDPGQETAPAAERSRGRLKPLLLLLAIVAVVAVVYLAGKAWQTAAESTAKERLQELGAVLMLDENQNHVQGVALLPSISSSNLDDVITLLPKLPYMEVLRLAGTPVSDAQLGAVAQCGSLASLGLNRTTIGDAGVGHLAGLSQLTALYLSETPVTSGSLEAIGTLNGLEILSLIDTKMDGDLAPLAQLDNLQHLLLSGVELSDEAIATISRLPKLTRLTIKGSKISDVAIEKLKETNGGIAVDR